MSKLTLLLLVAAFSLVAADKSDLLSKQELVKKKLARLEGMVTDIGKFPIADASVTVQRLEDGGNSPTRVELKTPEAGKFLLDALVPGKYEVRASRQGFKSVTRQFTLEPGKVTKALLPLSLSYR